MYILWDTDIPRILHPYAKVDVNVNTNPNIDANVDPNTDTCTVTDSVIDASVDARVNANEARMTPHSSTKKDDRDKDEDENEAESRDKDEMKMMKTTTIETSMSTRLKSMPLTFILIQRLASPYIQEDSQGRSSYCGAVKMLERLPSTVLFIFDMMP
ncbi:hypothetical protein PVK06_020706 [Gossypium arboreum]|uniref:Uncharacterized protein n=1 Tax=Gossypium arboreum TaxID=29729 RepID=A0ABR0PNA3_GOSAR|nr:hypothetical protein PVK06_020706 [Gossypium arboreum]